MAYEVIYTRSAAKDIGRLDRVAKKKIKAKIESYLRSPMTFAKKLVSSKIGQYRWRAGNHRIVFDVDGKTIVILRVGHRREIYK